MKFHHKRLRQDAAVCCVFAILASLLGGCGGDKRYFGRVRKPTASRLVFENGQEPASLDPQFMLTGNEGFIADALFDSLVRLHPITLEPTADVATHYERDPNATRYVFYLRGHPHPRGIKLANADDINEQFRSGKISVDLARGHAAPPDSVPAHWSDGTPVTAHDFVYSWRRLFDPRTAAPYAQDSTYILNSAQILTGQRQPKELGVRALDDWTLEVLLARPTDFFLEFLDSFYFFAVPHQAIEAAERRGAPASWTDPGRIVTDGPFRLAEWRPYESIVVRKNPDYWEAGLTGLDEIIFLPIADNLANINLYRYGEADTMFPPPAYLPVLKKLRDYQAIQAQAVFYIQCNTRQPPLDNVAVRYALNMATEKRQVARLFNGNQTPARTLVVPTGGYQPPSSVPVKIGGRVYDVTSYDPQGARELLAFAGFRGGLQKDGKRLRLDFIYTSAFPVAEELVEVLRRQWRENLGIELAGSKLDSALFFSALLSGRYKGLAQTNWIPGVEPVWFMDIFFASEQAGGTFWRPDPFVRLVEETKATMGRTARMEKLEECDRLVMEGMPVIPLIDNWDDIMMKPYVKSLPLNAANDFRFKYAWVKTN